MTVPVWPSDLPQRFSISGFSLGLGDSRLMTPMDAGPPKTRRRFSNVPDPVTGEMVVGAGDYARFLRFWADDTNRGALPFLIRDPLLDGQPMLTESGDPMLDEDGEPLLIEAWHLVLAGERTPSVVPVNNSGTSFRLSLALLVMP